MGDKIVAICLCSLGLCGIGGLHDFYLGKMWLGVLKLFTCNFFLIGTIIDLILLATDNYYYGNLNKTPKRQTTTYTPPVQTKPNRISDEGIVWEVGTDSQIDWAEDIAKKFVEKAYKLVDDALEKETITEAEEIELKQAIDDEVALRDNANWWIDNRTVGTKRLLLEMFEDNEYIMELVKEL